MRLHHYPGLFGDPRSRGLGWALGISLLVHVVLFTTAGRLHVRPAERTFFSPVHIVDLVEPAPAPKKAPPGPPTTPEATVKKEPAPPPAKKAAPTPKPAPPKTHLERVISKPAPEAKPEPRPEDFSEERVSDRIARLREKFSAAEPTPAERPSAEQGTDAGVEQAIAAIRERVGPTSGGTGSGTEAKVGIRGGSANTLQQVRLRAYYNQLWDHVTSHWAIPPSLKGLDYAVIVSVVLDRRGQIVKSWVEEPSGSEAFDQSALRALQRAQPLPPIPDPVEGNTLEVGFRFHPD